jgi:hypothetical protein
MLEKFGKFLRELFVHGPKGLEPVQPTEAKPVEAKPAQDRVEAPAPKAEPKPEPKDNVVIAPIKKEKKPAAKKPTVESKPKATKATKTPAASKAPKAPRKPKTT